MLMTRLVVVEAIPSPNMIIDSNIPIVGYYQRVGVTYESWEELTNLVSHFIAETDGTFLRIEEMWNPDFEGADRDIVELCGDWSVKGIWYYSGRAFYCAEEYEKEFELEENDED